MLGDLEESDSSDSASETQNHILPTPFSQNHSNHNNNRVHQLSSSSLSSEIIDEDLLYKRIWKYQIEKLVGSGAFSKFLDHPNIVKLEATMETQHYLCIVLQYVEDGELFDYIQAMHQKLAQKDQKVDEALIKNLFLQLVHVVGWMHEHNLIHRDLKLENILIQMVDGHPHLMVADFGLARVVEPGGPKLTTRCGSDEYAAPEIVQSLPYDGRETDTWALGVILYAMLVGYLPFMYQNERGGKLSHLFHRIIRAEVKWPVVADPTKDISPQAKDVVHRILVRRPEKRIRLQDIDQLPWFTDPAQ
ncbi:kinase-like domain-containing protein [Radiomyces spectabilis]|uniref:kinase-like domain-containing protein n=1 Tax=Radiomyces spectabilis TaxID=64574 RepID=UPI002220937C|nr:kinase-like domain-containing protein [Radiomyces spectabilis]KAI8374596.1 kinase-like domain-containing protein [Radiomyces spectabilis]